MAYQVTFYCPDRHIQYDGNTPYREGVGGGITARIRMARALTRAGHRVQMVVNCPRKARIAGVEYLPLDEVRAINTDVLVMNTSGGPLDLSPMLKLDVRAGLKFVWTSGTPRPGGLGEVGYDFVYAKSNFLRNIARDAWGIPQGKIFVAYNGFEESDFRRAERFPKERDPHRLVYFSHPSKGLDSAIAVLKRLRRWDTRYHLKLFGGARLWGQEEKPPPELDGLQYHGLLNQRKLVREILQCSYSINLQDRLEPFGMVLTESMRAGCLVLASPVGAYAELVRHGEDGFLIQGDHQTEAARDQAAALIHRLTQSPDARAYVQRNAQRVLWNTDIMVRVWEGHWRWWFETQKQVSTQPADRSFVCPLCGGSQLWLADGYHCLECGEYARKL